VKSELEIQEMVKLYVTNFFAIVFSLGLAIPWATIRVAKYKSTRMKLLETTGALGGTGPSLVQNFILIRFSLKDPE
jgi:uncharacterized membrane protein YjgN (DUF898 family)